MTQAPNTFEGPSKPPRETLDPHPRWLQFVLPPQLDVLQKQDVAWKPGNKTDAIGVAKKEGKAEIVTLLERFKGDAAKTRSEVKKELGINGQSVPFIFLH